MRVSMRIAVVGIAALLVLSWGCKSQVDDDAPVETATEAESPESVDIAELLPTESTLIASYHVDEFRRLRQSSPLPREVAEVMVLDVQVLRDLLSEESLPGLDPSGAIYVAASRVGFEKTLSSLRIGSPTLLDDIEHRLPASGHIRVVAPAEDAAALKASIQQRCDSLCPEIADISTRDSFVVIDLAWNIVDGEWNGEEATFEIEEGFYVEDTAAWKAFTSRNAPMALYGQMNGIFDQVAILHLGDVVDTVAKSAEIDRPTMRAQGLAQVVQEFTYDSPEVAESEDVAILLDREGNMIMLDAVASLTQYGQELVEKLAESAPMMGRNRADAALDIRWGLDLTATIAETTKPRWASDLRGLDESTFARMLDGQTRESNWGFPLGVFRSPITGYAMFDEFVGDQTTPAEFSMISGFWLQLFDVADTDIVSAMGLHLPADAPIESFQEFASVALLPFGSNVTSRSVGSGATSEFQATTGTDVMDLFIDEEITIAPGIQAEINLRRLASLIATANGGAAASVQQQMMLNVVANIGAPELYFHSGFDDGQGLVRLQWGGDALVTPTAVEGASAPQALVPPPKCLYSAREWSILGLYELADIGDNAERQALLADDIGGALDDLVDDCDTPEAEGVVRSLAADWRTLGE